jgi:hypothetical protein
MMIESSSMIFINIDIDDHDNAFDKQSYFSVLRSYVSLDIQGCRMYVNVTSLSFYLYFFVFNKERVMTIEYSRSFTYA